MSKKVEKRKADDTKDQDEDVAKKILVETFNLHCRLHGFFQRQRDIIANSSFQQQNPSDMKKPYYRVFIHLAFEDTQPPETYHATSLEAAQAMWEFFQGDYGYGQGSYHLDPPSWWDNEFYVPESLLGSADEIEIISVPEMATMIETAIATNSKYKVSKDMENYLEITRVGDA